MKFTWTISDPMIFVFGIIPFSFFSAILFDFYVGDEFIFNVSKWSCSVLKPATNR